MDKLRGSGNTFSTSGKAWHPFKHEAKQVKRAARLHRLIRAGKLKPASKAELRALAEQAVQAQHVTRS